MENLTNVKGGRPLSENTTDPSPAPPKGSHRILDADLQPPVLHHTDAGIWLPWPEDVLPFQKLPCLQSSRKSGFSK